MIFYVIVLILTITRWFYGSNVKNERTYPSRCNLGISDTFSRWPDLRVARKIMRSSQRGQNSKGCYITGKQTGKSWSTNTPWKKKGRFINFSRTYGIEHRDKCPQTKARCRLLHAYRRCDCHRIKSARLKWRAKSPHGQKHEKLFLYYYFKILRYFLN